MTDMTMTPALRQARETTRTWPLTALMTQLRVWQAGHRTLTVLDELPGHLRRDIGLSDAPASLARRSDDIEWTRDRIRAGR